MIGLLCQATAGVVALHKWGMVHRNLTAHAIKIAEGEDGRYSAFIGDLGCAVDQPDGSQEEEDLALPLSCSAGARAETWGAKDVRLDALALGRIVLQLAPEAREVHSDAPAPLRRIVERTELRELAVAQRSATQAEAAVMTVKEIEADLQAALWELRGRHENGR